MTFADSDEIFCPLLLGVVVGFTQTMVDVREDLEMVEVCVEIFSGTSTISIPFQILVSSVQGTASKSDHLTIIIHSQCIM